MYWIVVPLFLGAVAALMVAGIAARLPWALYVLNVLWFCGLVVAAYLTFLAWRDRIYSENWAMYGVIFFVWPYTLLVELLGGLELFLLRGDRSAHAARVRLMTLLCMGCLGVLSVVMLFAG
jgi:hypothetical protein